MDVLKDAPHARGDAGDRRQGEPPSAKQHHFFFTSVSMRTRRLCRHGSEIARASSRADGAPRVARVAAPSSRRRRRTLFVSSRAGGRPRAFGRNDVQVPRRTRTALSSQVPTLSSRETLKRAGARPSRSSRPSRRWPSTTTASSPRSRRSTQKDDGAADGQGGAARASGSERTAASSSLDAFFVRNCS